ncbi:MAG: cytochrome P450 [Ilumatobacteraceae bacterium]
MTTTPSTGTTVPGTEIPVLSADIGGSGPVYSHFEQWDALREQCPAFWNDVGEGHWVLTRFDSARKALQQVETFSTDSTIISDPNPEYMLLPLFLDPSLHVKYRQLYNARFSPGAVDRLTPMARQVCRDTIEQVLDRGHCDVINEFADLFPTQVFLMALGLPLEDAPQFVEWVRKIFLGLAGVDTEIAAAAQGEVAEYFTAALDDRRRHPRDPDADMTTYLLEARIDGEPISQDYLLSMLTTLVLAGLDTTKCQLGFNFHHLATHPEDRRRIVEDPSLIPSAVEEMLRVFAFVPPARKLRADIDYEGCPMKAGQMVLMPLWSANRDPRAFEDSERVVIDRSPNRHFAFGAGAHRCAGAHLARRELVIALEEWHRLIPDYELASDAPVVEHGWQIGLDTLPLRWDV